MHTAHEALEKKSNEACASDTSCIVTVIKGNRNRSSALSRPAVLVLELYHDDGAAVLVEQRRQLWKQHCEPGGDVGHVDRVARSQVETRVPPDYVRREASKVPLFTYMLFNSFMCYGVRLWFYVDF